MCELKKRGKEDETGERKGEAWRERERERERGRLAFLGGCVTKLSLVHSIPRIARTKNKQ